MSEELTPWEPQTRISNCIEIDDLCVSFERTIRVPDNESLNRLPPSLGKFPLFKTDDVGDKFPVSMAEKGGVFIPMYQREGMCVSFESEKRYAIKIFAGNVNVISGEPRMPDATLACRRPGLPSQNKFIQDYVVTPPPRIDGVVAKSQETACFQFEVTRLDRHEVEERAINIIVMALTGKPFAMKIANHAFIKDIQQKIHDLEGFPVDKQRLIFRGEMLQDGLLLCDYGIEEPETGQAEMVFPLGGVIRQNIVNIPKGLFQESNAVSFNVQILNSATFTAITGRDPPSTPVSAAVYQELGLPFYDLYEEPSRVSGLKSITQIEGAPEKALDNLSLIEAETGEPANKYENGKGETGDNPGHATAQKTHGDTADPKVGNIRLLDPRAPDSEVRFAWDVEAEI
ncbi:integral membrane protein [Fusarium mexicanum]|uniref:Integral membrane protein n=1 Tax=Fusarium mexicanum TaxID=751941 RepID=A0A8H5MJY6_9HYPO|nr:integral membrane protein [Fusarium mexicanum]